MGQGLAQSIALAVIAPHRAESSAARSPSSAHLAAAHRASPAAAICQVGRSWVAAARAPSGSSTVEKGTRGHG